MATCPRNNFSPCREECALNEGGICTDRLKTRVLLKLSMQLDSLTSILPDIDLNLLMDTVTSELEEEDEDESPFKADNYNDDEHTRIIGGIKYIKLINEEAEYGLCAICGRSSFNDGYIWLNDIDSNYYCGKCFSEYVEGTSTKSLVANKTERIFKWFETIGIEVDRDMYIVKINGISLEAQLFDEAEPEFGCEICGVTNKDDFNLNNYPFWISSDHKITCSSCLVESVNLLEGDKNSHTGLKE